MLVSRASLVAFLPRLARSFLWLSFQEIFLDVPGPFILRFVEWGLLFCGIVTMVVDVFVSLAVSWLFRRDNQYIPRVRQSERVSNTARRLRDVIGARVNEITLKANDRVGYNFYREGPSFKPSGLRRNVRDYINRRCNVKVNRPSVLTNQGRRAANSRNEIFSPFGRSYRPVRYNVEIATSSAFGRYQGGVVIRFSVLVMYWQVLLWAFNRRVVDGGCVIHAIYFRRGFRSIRRLAYVAATVSRRNVHLARFGTFLLRGDVTFRYVVRRLRRVVFHRAFRRMRLTA